MNILWDEQPSAIRTALFGFSSFRRLRSSSPSVIADETDHLISSRLRVFEKTSRRVDKKLALVLSCRPPSGPGGEQRTASAVSAVRPFLHAFAELRRIKNFRTVRVRGLRTSGSCVPGESGTVRQKSSCVVTDAPAPCTLMRVFTIMYCKLLWVAYTSVDYRAAIPAVARRGISYPDPSSVKGIGLNLFSEIGKYSVA